MPSTLRRLTTSLSCFLSLTLVAAPSALTAGSVLRVGPSRTYTEIQTAVDAARPGDLILVDTGTYGPIDVDGKGVAIVGATGQFRLTPRRGVPTLRIRNIPAGAAVSVVRWATEIRYGEAPAVSIERCAGAVRIKWADLPPVANLPRSTMRAVIRIVDSSSVHLDTVRVIANQRFRGSTVNGLVFPGGTNRGISAVESVRSRLHIVRSFMRGYDSRGTSEWAGDGLRLFGGAARIEEAPTLYEGGDGEGFGGSAVHWIGIGLQQDVLFCGRKLGRQIFVEGDAPNPGGRFAVNHDQGGRGPFKRNVPNCLGDSVGHSEAPTLLSIGASYDFDVSSLEARPFVAFVGPSGFGEIPGFEGKALLDYGSPSTIAIGAGTLQRPPRSPLFQQTIRIRVPSVPALAGLQLATQAVIGPGAGTNRFAPIFTMADLLVVVP